MPLITLTPRHLSGVNQHGHYLREFRVGIFALLAEDVEFVIAGDRRSDEEGADVPFAVLRKYVLRHVDTGREMNVFGGFQGMSKNDVSFHADPDFRQARFSVRFHGGAVDIQQRKTESVERRIGTPGAAVDRELGGRIFGRVGLFEAAEDVGEHIDGIFGEWVSATFAVDAQQENARVRRYDAERRFAREE